ncbi:hypothetical protein BKA67DRAFT_586059 [Truncatella angustata]|uniref:Uncharacterized protein n=1 Tax=Truncatella angustata TaxID=152316 RepID=A0A9P8U8X5_9PEZI|nr:uncharacterized protein BKA67DRAFT_586059 [Truncatella angustata]KAH6645664.1 hypothetical protein BKA67DRAFT_586059 [Truncatella angustata]
MLRRRLSAGRPPRYRHRRPIKGKIRDASAPTRYAYTGMTTSSPHGVPCCMCPNTRPPTS